MTTPKTLVKNTNYSLCLGSKCSPQLAQVAYLLVGLVFKLSYLLILLKYEHRVDHLQSVFATGDHTHSF